MLLILTQVEKSTSTQSTVTAPKVYLLLYCCLWVSQCAGWLLLRPLTRFYLGHVILMRQS